MLTEKELNEVNGGAIKLSVGTFLIIGGILSFTIGLINGYLRPLTCSSTK
ncbi:MAG TPA: class IIb bacteriocin, lactobin A/cerein 7B family [Candidatus Coprovivens excrementavium]|nr:class IIb bacteriocin, lactobin A/cerein 7B family [Candidatus Coprovivens excrementavium]